jgi:heme exporter protein CcmD
MKDYSAYIVPAFALTGLVLALLVWSSLAHARRWRRRFEERQAKDPARR